MAGEDDEGGAEQQQRDADPGDIEHADAGAAGMIDEQAIDHQVGAGADQCAGAAEDGGIAERQKQLGRGDVHALGPVLDGRNEHRHYGRVVDKGAEQRSGQHDTQERLFGAAWLA
ncbi:hypothetical protein D3C78_1217150 [compost metagenome]